LLKSFTGDAGVALKMRDGKMVGARHTELPGSANPFSQVVT
jgi:hypothetical protein